MKTSPLLVGGVIGAFVIAIAATIFVAVRLASGLAFGSGQGGLFGFGYMAANNAGNRCYENHDYLGAMTEYDKMVVMRPKQVDGYLLRGMAEFRAGLLKSAVRTNTAGLSLNAPLQTKASMYYNRAVDYDNLNDYPHAIADFTSDLAINPNEADARQWRADAYLSMKQYDLGIADCSYNIARHPHRVVDYFNRGKLYAAKEDNAHAIQDFTHAIDLAPSDMQYVSELGQLYQKTKQWDKNEALWKSAAERNPDNALPLGNYGWAQYLSGNIAGSIASTQRSLQIDPSQSYAKFNLGLCYAVTDKWSEAEPIYRQALSAHDAQATKGGLQDVRDALKTHPNSQALRQAEALLSAP